MSNVHTPSAHVLVKPSLVVVAGAAATVNGIGVDCLGYTRALVTLKVLSHDRDDNDETIIAKVQESADNSSFADVTNAVFATIATAATATKGDVKTMDLNLVKRLRYLRAVGTVAGTTPASTYSVDFHLFNAEYKAVTQDATVIQVL